MRGERITSASLAAILAASCALGKDRLQPGIPIGESEGQGGQIADVVPIDVSGEEFRKGTRAEFDSFYDHFLGVNVNVPFVSDVQPIVGDPTYDALRAARIDAADLSVDAFMGHKSNGEVQTTLVRWLQDTKTGEMVGYEMEIISGPEGKRLVDPVTDSQGNWTIIGRGEIQNSRWVEQTISLPGAQQPFDVEKIGNFLLGLDPELVDVAAAESTATPIPSQTLEPTEEPTPTATPEPIPFSVEPDAPFPEELGTPVIAVRWGEEGSFTVSTKDTPYTLTSPVGERPIFDTKKGIDFFFGLLAKAFGYPDAESYLNAVKEGTAKPVTFEKFGILPGPVTIRPDMISIVFEDTEIKDPARFWFVDRAEQHIRDTGGWIIYIMSSPDGDRAYFKYEIQSDGRAIIRISDRIPDPKTIKYLRDEYYGSLMAEAVYLFSEIASRGGNYPPPPNGIFDGVLWIGDETGMMTFPGPFFDILGISYPQPYYPPYYPQPYEGAGDLITSR